MSQSDGDLARLIARALTKPVLDQVSIDIDAPQDRLEAGVSGRIESVILRLLAGGSA